VGSLTEVVAVVAALGGVGGLVSLVSVRATRRHILAQTEVADAQAADVLTGAALRLVEPLAARVAQLEELVETLTRTLEHEREVSQQRITGLVADVASRDATIEQLRTRRTD